MTKTFSKIWTKLICWSVRGVLMYKCKNHSRAYISYWQQCKVTSQKSLTWKIVISQILHSICSHFMGLRGLTTESTVPQQLHKRTMKHYWAEHVTDWIRGHGMGVWYLPLQFPPKLPVRFVQNWWEITGNPPPNRTPSLAITKLLTAVKMHKSLQI